MKIGIFDLGTNGLSILKSVTKDVPQYDYLYFGDTENSETEGKTDKELLSLIENGLKTLIDEDCALIIIAPNVSTRIKNNSHLSEDSNTNVILMSNDRPNIIKEYLTNNPEIEHSLSRGGNRNIKLSDNSKEYIKSVTDILGGVFIDEN